MEQKKYNVIEKATPLYDARLKATGQLKYVDDMKLPNMLYGKIMHSPVAHAKIKSIDTSKAIKLKGVRAIVTYKDSPKVKFNANGEDADILPSEVVFDEVVRYVGDKVCAVAADTKKIADEAIKLIEVEYEELPFYLSAKEAAKEGAYPIHEEGNFLWDVDETVGDMDKGFNEADEIIESDYELKPVHHCAIEPHTSISYYDGEKLTVWTPTQDTFGQRKNLAKIFSMNLSKVRVINPAIGGAFGGKIDLVTEPVGAMLSIKTGRPIKITYNRNEDITTGLSRHAESIHIKSGVKKDGTITAIELTTYVAAGAHSGATMSAVWAPKGKFFTMFAIKNARFHAIPVYTNTINGTAMRGFGSPQIFYSLNAHFNEVANRIGMDLCDFELMNMHNPKVKDYLGADIGNMRGKDCVLRGKELFDYDTKIKEAKEFNDNNDKELIGIGMAAAPHGCSMFGVMPDTTGCMIKMNEDGSISFYTGMSDMGNGCNTTQMMVVSEVLGIPFSHISTIHTDTESTLFDVGIYASRGTYVGSGAALKAANEMREKILFEASELLEIATDKIDLKDNKAFEIEKEEYSVSMEEIAIHAHEKQRDISVSTHYSSSANPISAGAHFVKVKINKETGEVTPISYTAVHDVGHGLNPMQLEGQVHGGIQMGLGYALSEGLDFDEKGAVKNRRLRDCHMFDSTMMPKDIKVEFLDSYEESGPFGAKSVGECGTVPSAPAVANAVANALNCTFDHLPITKEDILEKVC